MNWLFDPYPPGMVEQDVTQGDQFRNDDVDLPDSLGRETIQNSLDAAAANNGPVRVRFSLLKGNDAPSSEFIREIFQGHLDHAQAANINVDAIDFDQSTALVIEDFGTKGLTGSVDRKDDDNFSDFWRRHGRSHKTGKSLGRWGLGKLVFSMSSQLKTFFGYTVQYGSGTSALMGQTVLGMHRLNAIEYPAHSFFADRLDPDATASLPVPIGSPAIVQQFLRQFRLQRIDEPGLSIMIPFPDPTIVSASMIEVAIVNYFIPILRRQLTVQVDDIIIDHTNVLDHALRLPPGKLKDLSQVFGFVRAATATTAFFAPSRENWYVDGKLSENEFDAEDLALMRDGFATGALVAVELSIPIERVGSAAELTQFHIFLQKPDGLTRGQDFYLRGGITLPQESKFRDRKALGMLLAEDSPIAAFLGDAENAAHTKWNGKAEKLRKYRSAEIRLKAIRNSVVELHDHLAQAVEEENERALIDFFWTPGADPAPKRQDKPEREPPVAPPPPATPPPIRITEIDSGITILPAQGLATMKFPVDLVVKLAYDVPSGNPFKLYSEADFDLADEDSVQIEAVGDAVLDATRNELRCQFSTADFAIRVFGFDTRRDLITRVSIEET